jgi:hypothetical protein
MLSKPSSESVFAVGPALLRNAMTSFGVTAPLIDGGRIGHVPFHAWASGR